MAAGGSYPVKRRNPFGDEVRLQSKVRVGLKQMIGTKEKEEINAYTKALLMKGANPNMLIHNGYSNGTNKENNCPVPCPLSCVHCKGRDMRMVKCADCDHTLCHTCCRICSYCNNEFCHFCTVLNNNMCQVKAICLNCLSTTH